MWNQRIIENYIYHSNKLALLAHYLVQSVATWLAIVVHAHTWTHLIFMAGTQPTITQFVCLYDCECVWIISAFSIIFFVGPQNKKKLDYNWINFIIFGVLYGLFSIQRGVFLSPKVIMYKKL